MPLHLRSRRRFRTVAVIAVSWILFLVLFYVVEYFFVHDLIELKKLNGEYVFMPDFLATIVLGAFGGFGLGYLLVFRMNPRYSHRSFAFGIFNSAGIFIVAFLVIAVIGLFLLAFLSSLLVVDVQQAIGRGVTNVRVNLSTPSFIAAMLVWALMVGTTQFMLQVSDKFGPGNLWRFIRGRYYQPRQEERIFMFLDLKSATTIAEKIGDER